MYKCKKILDDMLYIFTGEDGGIAFLRLRENLENIYKQADAGDPASIEIVNRVEAVNNLFKYFSNLPNPKLTIVKINKM